MSTPFLFFDLSGLASLPGGLGGCLSILTATSVQPKAYDPELYLAPNVLILPDTNLTSAPSSIPIQSIATNGPSLVHKVRFVASTLLDAVSKAETAPVSAARAHGYLWDFLSILSEIERNYLSVFCSPLVSSLDS